jgi:PTH1 family peptidyl-tRNA hydrolase
VLRALARLFGRRHDEEQGPVKVIVGLGNPGKEYERTRHNVGWWVVDHLADVWHFDGWRRDGEARVANGQVAGQKVRLVKPQTYMNLSGSVLRPYMRRAGWSPQRDLMVIVDEVALPLGSYRFRGNGSAGGHNGLKSVEAALERQDYARLRIGVGPVPPGVEDLADFVLAPLEPEERRAIEDLLEPMAEAVEFWMAEGVERAMSRFNR